MHRDLKPANLLISNQHYCHQNIDETREAWEKEPIICKLVDFGESRAALQQTGTLCQTRTNNVDRGTVGPWNGHFRVVESRSRVPLPI